MNKRILWGIGTARTFRAHWALIELKLEYETQGVETRSAATAGAEYRRLNNTGKIPTLVDGEVIVNESTAIINFLATKYDTSMNTLMPKSLRSLAAYHQWMSFIGTELDATALYVLRRHEGLPEIYGTAQDACITARKYFNRMIESAADKIEDGRTYLLGERFSGADIMMMSILDWAEQYKCKYPDVFKTYQGRLSKRPNYLKAIKANTAP
jgi:glutathione S-transferase